jgi:hypothetical protein
LNRDGVSGIGAVISHPSHTSLAEKNSKLAPHTPGLQRTSGTVCFLYSVLVTQRSVEPRFSQGSKHALYLCWIFVDEHQFEDL